MGKFPGLASRTSTCRAGSCRGICGGLFLDLLRTTMTNAPIKIMVKTIINLNNILFLGFESPVLYIYFTSILYAEKTHKCPDIYKMQFLNLISKIRHIGINLSYLLNINVRYVISGYYICIEFQLADILYSMDIICQ